MNHPSTSSGPLRGLATLLAAAATFGRSYRRFDWRGGADERHRARSEDGWNLALFRYRPAGVARAVPVLCSHGMAGTHLIFDLDPDHYAPMTAHDRSIVYSDRIGEVRMPLLLLAAARDLQRPPESVRAAYEALGSADKTFVRVGTASGFQVDYGHDDLLAGLAAPAEVFPLIAGWLAERNR